MRAAVLYPDRIQGMVLMDPLVTSALTPSALAHRRKYPLLVTVEFLARMLNALGIRRRMPHYSLRAHDRKAREMLARGGDALQAFIDEYSSPLKDLGHIHTACYMRDILEVGQESSRRFLGRRQLFPLASDGMFRGGEPHHRGMDRKGVPRLSGSL